MSWRDCRLGDVLTLKRGHDLPEKRRVAGPIPVVSSSGITGYHNEAKAQPPGVVTGRYGTLGKVYFIDQEYWPLNTALYVIDFKDTHPRFAAYFLKNTLRNYQSDKAAVPGVDRNVLHELKVRAPDGNIQEAIGTLLSVYDDLIENNRRRMTLLEEAAQQLYREWFVRLRFPGHEHTSISDGVPEGWEKLPLGEIATLNYGKALKKSARVPGAVAVYGSSGVVGDHETKLVEGPSIIIGRKGNVGSVYWVDGPSWPIDTVYYVDPEQTDLYLFHSLQRLPFQSSDAAVPGLNRNYAYSLPVMIPQDTLRAQFEDFVTQNFTQIQNLKLSNQKLGQARDLLLPRLMSGELPV